MNSWLQLGVVVLNVVNDFGETPKGISLGPEQVFFELQVDFDYFLGVNVSNFFEHFVNFFNLLCALLPKAPDSVEVFFFDVVDVKSVFVGQQLLDVVFVEFVCLALVGAHLKRVLPFILLLFYLLQQVSFDEAINLLDLLAAFVKLVLVNVCFHHVLTQEHKKKRSTQVVDALHVPAGGVSHGPYKQDPGHHALHLFATEDPHIRLSPEHVDLDLFEVLLLEFRQT